MVPITGLYQICGGVKESDALTASVDDVLIKVEQNLVGS